MRINHYISSLYRIPPLWRWMCTAIALSATVFIFCSIVFLIQHMTTTWTVENNALHNTCEQTRAFIQKIPDLTQELDNLLQYMTHIPSAQQRAHIVHDTLLHIARTCKKTGCVLEQSEISTMEKREWYNEQHITIRARGTKEQLRACTQQLLHVPSLTLRAASLHLQTAPTYSAQFTIACIYTDDHIKS